MNQEDIKQEDKDESAASSNPLSAALQTAMKELLNAKVKDIVAFTTQLAKEAGIDLSAIASSQASAPQEAQEEQTEFTVNLDDFGTNKIAVIKVVKELTGLGLMEAKNLVESAPKPIKQDIKKEEAEDIKQKLEAAGAKVSLT